MHTGSHWGLSLVNHVTFSALGNDLERIYQPRWWCAENSIVFSECFWSLPAISMAQLAPAGQGLALLMTSLSRNDGSKSRDGRGGRDGWKPRIYEDIAKEMNSSY